MSRDRDKGILQPFSNNKSLDQPARCAVERRLIRALLFAHIKNESGGIYKHKKMDVTELYEITDWFDLLLFRKYVKSPFDVTRFIYLLRHRHLQKIISASITLLKISWLRIILVDPFAIKNKNIPELWI